MYPSSQFEKPSQFQVHSSLYLHVKKAIARLIRKLAPTNEPRIYQKVDGNGQAYWLIFDPETRQLICFDTESDIRVWLEQRLSFSLRNKLQNHQHSWFRMADVMMRR